VGIRDLHTGWRHIDSDGWKWNLCFHQFRLNVGTDYRAEPSMEFHCVLTDGVRLVAVAGPDGFQNGAYYAAEFMFQAIPARHGYRPAHPRPRLEFSGSSADGTRLAAVNGAGEIWMNGLPPSVTTAPASPISYGRETLNGKSPRTLFSHSLVSMGNNTNYGNSTAAQTVGYSASAISLTASIATLSAGTTYHSSSLGRTVSA